MTIFATTGAEPCLDEIEVFAGDANVALAGNGTVATASASLTFSATETVTYECTLDSGGWTSCTSPRALSGLTDGSHTFQVRGTDAVAFVLCSLTGKTRLRGL